MLSNNAKITGILLAGGMSQRMGSEKGNIRIGRSLLYQYPLRVLEELCDEILISTCKDVTFQGKHRTICDEVKGIGPLGGIYSCLKQSSSELNLVLSYDMPLVSPSLFRFLIGERMGYDIVLPAMHEKKPEPTCGIYSRSTTGFMEEMIVQKDFALHHMLKRCNNKIVRITREMDFWLPELFLNINSKEDLKRIPSGFGQ
ncbi:MAG: molybdenum cofactor guanylyltransferase [Bacteroidota bacterium]|nr:molybdenum cofactor guanylyltransferase [Bacteroidota bacterium]